MVKTGSRQAWILWIAASVAVGAFLRLYQIHLQVIGGDEWNGLRIAARFSWSHIFTHFHVADNCIPLTAFYKVFLETIGLSELGLHGPSIFFGILMLFVFPRMIRPLFPMGVTVIFAFLIALSPFLVYYSRYGRPYILVVFFSFVSFFSFYLYLKEQRKTYLIIYIVSAVLSPYFNLLSIAAVVSPMVFSLLFLIIIKLYPSSPSHIPSLKPTHLLLTGMFVTFGIMVWFIPTFESLDSIIRKAGQDYIEVGTLVKTLRLYSGTDCLYLSITCLVLLFIGIYYAYRHDPFLCTFLLFIMAAQLALIVFSKPLRIQSPLVLGRYLISCLPLWLLFIAIALHAIIREIGIRFQGIRLGGLLQVLPVVLIFLIFLKGPFLNIYDHLNNFTNHGDFQYDYGHAAIKITDDQRRIIPSFYLDLKREPESTTIIETPYFAMWMLQNYHFYQIHHEKRVWVGHDASSYVCHPRTPPDERIRFSNMVNIHDQEAVRSCKAKYVIIHKDLLAERHHIRKSHSDYLYFKERLYTLYKDLATQHGRSALQEATRSISFFKRTYGDPHFEDPWITVFKIR